MAYHLIINPGGNTAFMDEHQVWVTSYGAESEADARAYGEDFHGEIIGVLNIPKGKPVPVGVVFGDRPWAASR